MINAEYERGLILHMESYDIMKNLDCADAKSDFPEDDFGSEGCEHYYSYTSNGTEYIQSGHCAMLIEMEHGRPVTFAEMNRGGDYDPYLPAVDENGNEVEDAAGCNGRDRGASKDGL